MSWRFLAAATLGQAAGYNIINYVGNIFTPHLLAEFAWTRADIARIGALAFLGIVTLPVAGRVTDAFGVRRIALVGVLASPLVFIALATMTGSLAQYFLITFLHIVVVGGTTSAVVYSRLVAQSFSRARGVALAIGAAAAPLAGAASAPFLSALIDAHGWRAGYLVVGACVAVVGIVAIVLIPRHADSRRIASVAGVDPANRYGAILRSRAFQLIVGGLLLCNLSFTMQTAHLKVILLDRGIDSTAGTLAVSLFAASVVVGRLACGVALDRFPAWAVTAIALACPGIGLGILATGTVAMPVITVAVMLLGAFLGAEGDVFAYLAREYFPIEIFATVLGLLIGALALSVAAGSLILGLTLDLTGVYTSFLVLCCVCALVGSALFVRLRREPTID